MACAKPLFATNAVSRELARAVPGWTYVEIETGHDAMLLMPEELASLLAAIA